MSKLTSCAEFIWDNKKKKFFGRNGRAWAEICSFFLVFFVVLLSYFLGMLSFFFQTISDREPYLTGDAGFLTEPGLGVRPLLKTDDGQTYTSMIHFTNDIKDKSTKACVKSMKETLKPYKKAESEHHALHWRICGTGKKPDSLQSCIVSYMDLTTECNENNNFGYPTGKPCILLRLNKVYGWKPKPFTGPDNSMPTLLKAAVEKYYIDKQPSTEDLVWVYCEGEDNFDKGNLGNQIIYRKMQGFPVSHFPYLNQYRHLAPAIMVQFQNMTPNIGIKVHCKTYAHNIEFNMKTWAGGYHLEFFFEKT